MRGEQHGCLRGDHAVGASTIAHLTIASMLRRRQFLYARSPGLEREIDAAILCRTCGRGQRREKSFHWRRSRVSWGGGDHDVYYDQTLPALVSAMGINRNEILKRIRDNQKSDADTYTLGAAGSDVRALESASPTWRITTGHRDGGGAADAVLPAPPDNSEPRSDDTDAALDPSWRPSQRRQSKPADCYRKEARHDDAQITPLNNQDASKALGGATSCCRGAVGHNARRHSRDRRDGKCDVRVAPPASCLRS